PNVRMILVHAGMLTERTEAAITEWRGALTAMAAFPNLNVKLSGLGMYSHGLGFAQARQVIRDCIQIFGAERTIYGSNFPLEKLHASYADFFGHYRRVMSEYTAAEQRAHQRWIARADQQVIDAIAAYEIEDGVGRIDRFQHVHGQSRAVELH